MADQNLTLPPGSRLLHIGIPKTGTTSVQYGSHRARAELLNLGVRYPGKKGHHQEVAKELLRKAPGPNCAELRTELTQGKHRSFITSELLSYGDIEVARLARELVGPNSHVILTIRGIASLLPSLWQEEIKKGLTTTLEDWLRAGFAHGSQPHFAEVPLFDEIDGYNLISRWAEVFGKENLTVLLVEKSEPSRVFDTFEGLLALPSGFYQVNDYNRGLTAVEVELVRQLNIQIQETGGLPQRLQRELIQQGICKQLQLHRTPPQTEPKILMPDWANQVAIEVGRRYERIIYESGVRVIGNLAELSRPAVVGENQNSEQFPEDLVTSANLALLRRAIKMSGLIHEIEQTKAARALARSKPKQNFVKRFVKKLD